MKKLNSPKSVGFEFVQKGKYPDFIKNHSFFKQTTTGSAEDKIFPSLGLPNTVEDVFFINNDMGNYARSALAEIVYSLHSVSYYQSPENQALIRAFLDTFRNSYDSAISNSPEGKIELRIPQDVIINGKVLYKKGKSIFKIYTAIEGLCKAEQKVPPLDNIAPVKAFNSCNVPAAGMKIFFSSTGEEGYWDLATISMRGIASCQAWSAAQSKALISGISSRYVGVIYIGTGEPFNEYGSRMIRRALVRFVIHKETKEKAIYVDNIYPAGDIAAANVFKKFIAEKTGLKVLSVNVSDDLKERTKYFVPNESTWINHPLGPGEDFYFDSPITLTRVKNQVPANIAELNVLDQKLQILLKKFATTWIGTRKDLAANLDWQQFINHLNYSPLNLIYNTCATLNRNLTQKEYNRNCIRHTLVNFKASYDYRINQQLFYGFGKNRVWKELSPEFMKETRRLLLLEYKNVM